MLGAALVGCAGPLEPVGLSGEDKSSLDAPLFRAELVVYGICPTTTSKFDADANRCAAILTQATANVAAVHRITDRRDITDPVLDDAAAAVNRYEKICDPEDAAASIVDCLGAAETIKVACMAYVKTLRAKLDAVK